MNRRHFLTSAAIVLPALVERRGRAQRGRTIVSIDGERFRINGQLTYAGRTYRGHPVEGLLMNSRMVQGIFDDLNPGTRGRWAYPDTGRWDAERNTREFLAAMPVWRQHGLLGITLNLQGGSPEGYSKAQPWHNSAFDADGTLRDDYLGRLTRVLDRADALGMVVILGYCYFGQDERLRDEAAVVRATRAATTWLLDGGWRNVIVEVNNECDVPRYEHAILRPPRVPELIALVRGIEKDGRRLPVGTSFGGGTVPTADVVRASDLVLIHGNGVNDPARITGMVQQTRGLDGWTPKPIVFNEDDHFDFDRPVNNMPRTRRGDTSTQAGTTTRTATRACPSDGTSTPIASVRSSVRSACLQAADGRTRLPRTVYRLP
jgi:hypothetical protein